MRFVFLTYFGSGNCTEVSVLNKHCFWRFLNYKNWKCRLITMLGTEEWNYWFVFCFQIQSKLENTKIFSLKYHVFDAAHFQNFFLFAFYRDIPMEMINLNNLEIELELRRGKKKKGKHSVRLSDCRRYVLRHWVCVRKLYLILVKFLSLHVQSSFFSWCCSVCFNFLFASLHATKTIWRHLKYLPQQLQLYRVQLWRQKLLSSRPYVSSVKWRSSQLPSAILWDTAFTFLYKY